jgi:hypothetical protein
MSGEQPTREIWREAVVCAMLMMSEEDRDWVRSQIQAVTGRHGKPKSWVQFLDSDRLRELLPLEPPEAGA